MKPSEPCMVCGKPTSGPVCLRRKCIVAYQDYLENGEMEKPKP